MKSPVLSSKAALKLYPGLFVVALYLFQVSLNKASGSGLFIIIFDLLLLLLPVYFNLFVFFPVFLRNKKYLSYLGSIVLTTIVISTVPLIAAPLTTLSKQVPLLNFSNTVILVLLSTGYQYAVDYFYQKRRQWKLEQRQLETENQLLRMQLHPHFLFNTLNNFYGLARNKSDRLPGLILKLSELFRYLNDNIHRSQIALEDELQFINTYLELQELRLDDRVHTDFSIEKYRGDLSIPPALLINFLENAFKHLNTEILQPFLIFELKVKGEQLILRCFNSHSITHKSQPRTGKGLANSKKRLNLHFDQKHRLQIRSGNCSYFVKLQINLQ